MNAVDTSTPTYDLTVPATLTIATPEHYEGAAEQLKTIALYRKRVTEFFAGMKSKALAVHREICAKEKQALTPALNDEAKIRRALVAYNDAIERQRREERIALERQERERMQEERLTMAVTLSEEATITGDASLHEAAEHLLSAPIAVAPVQPMTQAAPKVEGISYCDVWKFEVVDARLLPLDYLMPNEKAIGRVVDGLKDKASIPGVRVWSEKTTVARTR